MTSKQDRDIFTAPSQNPHGDTGQMHETVSRAEREARAGRVTMATATPICPTCTVRRGCVHHTPREPATANYTVLTPLWHCGTVDVVQTTWSHTSTALHGEALSYAFPRVHSTLQHGHVGSSVPTVTEPSVPLCGHGSSSDALKQ
jgi:hypothetical protein